jgi:hypothetical protein
MPFRRITQNSKKTYRATQLLRYAVLEYAPY